MPNQKYYEPYLTKIAREEADRLGIPGSGLNDSKDAFRHAYISAIITYYAGKGSASTLGEINEIKGDFLNNQPFSQRHMDEFNNEVGREIGSNAANREEIAQKVYNALARGELIIKDGDTEPSSPFPDNDSSYTPPLSVGGENFVAGEWDWMDERGTQSTGSINSGALIEALVRKKRGNRSTSVGQAVLTSAVALARELAKSRQSSLEDAVLKILTGKDKLTILNMQQRGGTPFNLNGSPRGVPDMLGDVIERMVGSAFSRQRTRVTSQESTRSRETSRKWNPSLSQQQAMLAQWGQRGLRNL